MKILIAGGSGFVGSHLGPHLKQSGHVVTLLTRQSDLKVEGYDEVLTWGQLNQTSAKNFY